MATYYVNAAGSNTSPFDTVEKGATSIGYLAANAPGGLLNGDIVEVVEAGGTITEPGSSNIPAGVVIRSYAGNTAKPSIQNVGGTNVQISTDGTIQDIIFRSSGGNTIGIRNFNMSSAPVFENCSFIGNGSGTAIECWVPVGAKIRNCFISNYYVGIDVISFHGTGSGNHIVNNTIYNCQNYGISYVMNSSYVVNNIVVGCVTYGISLSGVSNTLDYNDVYNCGTPYNGGSGGPNSILTDPLFVNTSIEIDGFKKQSGSPCVDTGATNSTYPGVIPTVDYFGVARATDMGFDEFEAVVRLNYFSSASVADGTVVTSYISRSDLVAAIQADSTDTYLDSTNELSRVMVFYRDSGLRQDVRIVHEGSGLSGLVAWAPGARDGTWEKYKVIAFDANGARHQLNRTAIGTAEDLTHDGTVMTLNT
jgi:hypothetical protein